MVSLPLFCFLMKCVLVAERAVLVELDTLCIVLLILHSVIISLLAFLTSHCNLYSHFGTSFVRFVYIINITYKFLTFVHTKTSEFTESPCNSITWASLCQHIFDVQIQKAGIIIRLQGHPRPLQSNFFMP